MLNDIQHCAIHISTHGCERKRWKEWATKLVSNSLFMICTGSMLYVFHKLSIRFAAIMEKLWLYRPFTILFYKLPAASSAFELTFHSIFSHSSFQNNNSGNVLPWFPIKTKLSIYFSSFFHPYVVAADADSFQWRIKINFLHLFKFIDIESLNI